MEIIDAFNIFIFWAFKIYHYHLVHPLLLLRNSESVYWVEWALDLFLSPRILQKQEPWEQDHPGSREPRWKSVIWKPSLGRFFPKSNWQSSFAVTCTGKPRLFLLGRFMTHSIHSRLPNEGWATLEVAAAFTSKGFPLLLSWNPPAATSMAQSSALQNKSCSSYLEHCNIYHALAFSSPCEDKGLWTN